MPNDRAPTTISDLKRPTQNPPAIAAGFGSLQSFELMQRIGKMLASSPLVPEIYRGPEGVGSCVIALNMAMRMDADPLMIMQNLYVVHGRPSWSAQFLIACFNQCGRFSAIRYRWQGTEGKDDWGCRAWAVERESGKEIVGPLVTMGLARKEQWFDRKGSKWQTIPELMLTYRAAAWMVRTHAPELAMGLPTADESEDIVDITPEHYSVEQVAAGEHAEHGAKVDAETAPTEEEGAFATASMSSPPVADDLAGGWTFAQIADLIRAAKTAENCDEAADLIRTHKDERQRAELDVELRARRKALTAQQERA